MLSLYVHTHTLHHSSKLKFTQRSSSWGTFKILFVHFPLTPLRYGGLFCRLCPSNYPINKSCRGHDQEKALAINHYLLFCHQRPLPKPSQSHLWCRQFLNPLEITCANVPCFVSSMKTLSILVSHTCHTHLELCYSTKLLFIAWKFACGAQWMLNELLGSYSTR
jgi:hypothetical protein